MKKLSAATAFSLVELTLALGIAAFCLMTVFALVPVAVLTNRNSTSQTAATNIIAAVVADLRATPAGNPNSTEFCIPFATSGSSAPLYFDSAGQCSTDLAGSTSPCGSPWTSPITTSYQLNISWHGSATLPYANLKGTWPAAATAPNARGSVEIFAAFYRN